MHHSRVFSLILFLALPAIACRAQKDTAVADGFQTIRQQLLDEFNDFRRDANKEYAGFLSQVWEEFTFIKGKQLFEKPKLPQPVVAERDSVPSVNNKIEIQEIKEEELESSIPSEIKAQLESVEENADKPFNVSYYGATLPLRYQLPPISLLSIREAAVSNLWMTFSQTRFKTLLLDMLDHKEKMKMNDWAYFLFTQKIAGSLIALKDANSKLVFQSFLLVQSGYDVRLARIDDFLTLLVPIRETVYARPLLDLGGKSYYVISDKKLDSYTKIYSYQLSQNRDNGTNLSLSMKFPLLLPNHPQTFAINAAGMEVKGEINQNKMNFYHDYPLCHFLIHARALPDVKFHQTVTNSLKRQLVGNDSIAMLNKLLLWVQMGFKYKTDDKQFGYEKPFFIEENFYYPYNDCEDRAILFCYLVNYLFGFDAVLLDYPNHIATAVQVNKNIPGDYININRDKYIICDPTFVNAQVGRSMLRYKEEKPKVFRIK